MRKKINAKTASPFFTAETARKMVEDHYHYEYDKVLAEAYDWIRNRASKGETHAIFDAYSLKLEDVHALRDHLKSNGYSATCIDQLQRLYISW